MDQIQERLLAEVADLHGVPEGAYNIRANVKMAGRSTTANIDITTKTDKPGIDIKIKPGTKHESVHIYFCSRIQNTFSCTVTFTVMLFYVFNFRILSNEKSVDAVMLRVLIATVVDTTACYDHYIRVFTNVEIIVNHFL